MSAEAQLISPARFAEAIADLPLSSLHLKVLEIRNGITHLDYSNEQLLPFAQGTASALGADSQLPDQDCIDAIRENQTVIDRKLEQLRLVRAEVEKRGTSWTEFQSKEEVDQQQVEAAQRAATTAAALAASQAAVGMNGTGETNGNGAGTNGTNHTTSMNGVNGASDPWSDGTFTVGTIRNGMLHMDTPGRPQQSRTTGGSLTDDQLRRALGEHLRVDSDGTRRQQEEEDDEDGGGLHL